MSRRHRHSRVVPFLVAAAWMSMGAAAAQTADPGFSSLLTPEIDGNPRQAPGFSAPGRSGGTGRQLPTFGMPPASGAAATGFNSTNLPRAGTRAKARPAPARAVAAPPLPLPVNTPPAVRRAAQRAQADRMTTGAIGIESRNFYAPPPIRRIPEEENPFDPLGWRAGAFLIKPAVELSAGFDSNPARLQNGTGSGFYVIAPELLARSDWERHMLNVDLRGSYTGYGSSVASDRPSFDAKVDSRVDVLRNTSLDLQGRLTVGTDNPGSPNVQSNLARLPVYSTMGLTAGVTQRLNRFEVSAKGSVDRTAYQASNFTNGATQSNNDRNYNQYGARLRGSYETLPGVKPFVEIATDSRAHDLPADRSGFQRDSTGLTYRAGASLALPKRLNGEISAGYTSRSYLDPRLTGVSGFVFDSSLAWNATPLTTATLNARSAVNELTQPGLSGYLSRDIGVQIDHAFRRYLIATMRAGIGFDTYDCACRHDQRYVLSAGFTYKATREVHIKGEVRREWLNSNLPNQDYSADIVTLGVRLQR